MTPRGTPDPHRRRRPRLVHLTTTDISLELLLGPQLEAFSAEGYEVIGVSAPGDFVDAVRSRGIEHIPLDNATRSMDPRRDLLALGELHRLFRRLAPDIVHTHNPKPGLYGRIAAGAAGVPVVVNTVHGLYALPEDNWKKKAVVYTLERIASTFSDAELVQNPEDVTTLRRVLREPVSKLTLLGNGIDLDRFHRDHRDEAERAAVRRRVREEFSAVGSGEHAVVVGAVGRLVLEKGYAELLEAWESLRQDHPEAILVIVGPSDDQKSDSVPADLIQRARDSGVRFLGMRSDVQDLYLGFDVYVLASHREGFPRSAMEAAASGLPIVATDIRGCRQVVDGGENGYLFPAHDAAELEAVLRRIISDTGLRESLAAKSAAKARTQFDQRDVIQRTLDTYRRLLRAAGLREPEPTRG